MNSRNGNRRRASIGMIMLLLLLSACNQAATTQKDKNELIEITNDISNREEGLGGVLYEADDYYQAWQEHQVTKVTFNGQEVDIEGDGVAVTDNDITISQAGIYVLSGQFDNGQVIINSQSEGTVRIILNEASLHNEDGAAIYVVAADKTVISLEPDTINTLTDGITYSFAADSTDEPDAVLFSKVDLTINGMGTLVIAGSYYNGITSKDGLKLVEGNYQITAVHNAVKGKDYISVKDGVYVLQSGNDGMKSTNSSNQAKGFIAIEGGNFEITSDADGIQAETSLLVTGGRFDITTGGGSGAVDSADISQSAKGLKAGTTLALYNGSFVIDAIDDSIHSDGDITIEDGYFHLKSGDDGVHANDNLWVRGGEIIIEESYEGLESSYMEISGGEIYINASDDGINVASGNDNSGNGGKRGADSFGGSNLNNELHITGGYIVIDSQGDGLDANGNIYMSGGLVLVNGPANGPDVAVDFDGSFEMTGGILIAAGSSGMAQAPTEIAGIGGVMVVFGEKQAGGTLASIVQDETAILSFAPIRDYQTILFCSPDFNKGESYEVHLGGTLLEDDKDGFYNYGSYQGGELYETFTQGDEVVWLGTQTMDRGGFNRGFGEDNKNMQSGRGFDDSSDVLPDGIGNGQGGQRLTPADGERGDEPPEFTN